VQSTRGVLIILVRRLSARLGLEIVGLEIVGLEIVGLEIVGLEIVVLRNCSA
jgi:hypothetical protein